MSSNVELNSANDISKLNGTTIVVVAKDSSTTVEQPTLDGAVCR